jgi:iron complex outermembrane recepter protein
MGFHQMSRFTGCAVVALQFAMLYPVAAHANEAVETVGAPDAAVDSDASPDMIIVTGTRDATRTQFETLAPVDVLSDDAVDNVVSEDLSDVLARLLPSFNVQRLPAADGQAFVRPASLRSLSPDHTLVLVNGKRYHRSALLGGRGAQAPDLNTIPTIAIKRIEVLRDGASAQYGSDAIAGVINIILDDEPGMDAFGQFSQYYEGDGDNYQVGVQGGLALDDRGSIVFSGEYSKNDATSRTRQRPDAIALQAARPDLAIPNPVQRWGQPDSRIMRAAVNMRYALSDALEIYAFGTAAGGDGVTDFNWRNPVATGNVYANTTVFPGFNFSRIYPAGFTPRFGTEHEDLQAMAGLRSANRSADFTFDVSASSGRSRIDYLMSESLNASLGPNSPTGFYLGRLEQREFNFNADFVYRLDVGGFEPINVAFGGERREETYTVTAGDPASYAVGPGAVAGLAPNANGFPGFAPNQAGSFGQESYAGYLDLEWRPAEMLTLGAAARYEDFSNFGDTFDYKLSARFEPTEGLAIRGAYSTGFRAPTPGQSNTSNTAQGLDTVSRQIFTRGRLSTNDPVAIALGAKPLQPEQSETFTAGLTFQSTFGLSASIDIYQIDVSDRFGQSNAFAVPKGVPNPLQLTSISYFTNDFDTRTRGVDVVIAYSAALGSGTLNARLAYNYNQTEVTNGTSITIGNDTQRRLFEERLPQHNATGSIGYSIEGLTVTAAGRYYGAWTDSSGNATGDIFQRFGSIVLFDLSAGYQFTENLSVKVGAENIFDTYPDEATNQAVRGLIYSRNAPYDTDGGQYYVRLGVQF